MNKLFHGETGVLPLKPFFVGHVARALEEVFIDGNTLRHRFADHYGIIEPDFFANVDELVEVEANPPPNLQFGDRDRDVKELGRNRYALCQFLRPSLDVTRFAKPGKLGSRPPICVVVDCFCTLATDRLIELI